VTNFFVQTYVIKKVNRKYKKLLIHIQQSKKDTQQTHVEKCTILIWMQDDSHICKGKIYLSKSETTPSPNIKHLLRKNILLTSYKKYTQHISFYLPLSISVSIFTASAFISLTLNPNIPSPSLPFHNISSVLCSKLDTQHFLKPSSHFWWDVLPCHYEPHWLNTTFLYMVYKFM